MPKSLSLSATSLFQTYSSVETEEHFSVAAYYAYYTSMHGSGRPQAMIFSTATGDILFNNGPGLYHPEPLSVYRIFSYTSSKDSPISYFGVYATSRLTLSRSILADTSSVSRCRRRSIPFTAFRSKSIVLTETTG